MDNNFEIKVKEQVERYSKKTKRQLEKEIITKRLRWLEENDFILKRITNVSPREAYEILFFDYLGLSREEVPVVDESSIQITWHSLNRCTALEACKELGFDTRKFCRAVYEKSTQVFISHIDPQLRFLRDYKNIRPYSKYCREMIIKVDFEKYMKTAIDEGRKSLLEGNKGYGALIIYGDKIIGQAHDITVTSKDPSLHAELIALKQAVKNFGSPDLSGSILFSTCEPCPMCSSLAVWANISAIVYGASIKETAELGKSRIMINCKEIIEESPCYIEVYGGILKSDCLALYKNNSNY